MMQPDFGSNGSGRPARPTIGVLMTRIGREWGSVFLAGVVQVAKEQDVNLYCFAGGPPDNGGCVKDSLYGLITRERLDGLILYSDLGHGVQPETLRRFCSQFAPLPIVGCALEVAGIVSALPDNLSGMHQAITHLVEVHGHRRIAFVRGPEGQVEAEQRFQAYCQVLTDHDIPLYKDLIVPGDFTRAAGQAAVRTLLDERQAPFSALAAANDNMAFGVLEELQGRGVQVPAQVALTGFDDVGRAQFSGVPLTTVRQQFSKLGQQALGLLLGLIRGETVPSQVMVPTELVVRWSCGCLPPEVRQVVIPEDIPGEAYPLEALELRRETAVEALIKAANTTVGPDLANHGPLSPMKKAMANLWDACLTDLKGNEPPDRFLSAFDYTLHELQITRKNPSTWHAVLSTLRRQVLSCLHEKRMILRAENLLQQARLLVGESAQRAQATSRLAVERQDFLLQQLDYDLTAVMTLPDMEPVIGKHFPGLGVTRCYVNLFEPQMGDSPEGAAAAAARLLLAYDEHGVKYFPDSPVFPAWRLLPDETLPEEKSFIFVATPLSLGDHRLGFMLTELGPPDWELYPRLRDLFSGSILRAQLVEQQAQARREVERLLAEAQQRAAELTLANEAAQAAHLAEKRRRTLAETLEQTGRVMTSSLNLSEAPERILEQLDTVVPFERGSILMQHEDEVQIVAQRGFPDERRARGLRIPIREGDVYEQVAAGRCPLIVEDVSLNPAWQQIDWLPLDLSWMGVPLISRDRVIGMMSLTRQAAGAFTADDSMVASAFAGQAGIALENAKLYDEICRFNEQLELTVQARTEELHQANQTLAAERNLLRTLVDSVPDAIYVKDAQSQIVLDNPAHARLLGAAGPTDVVGKTDFDYFPPGQASGYHADDLGVLRSGEPLMDHEETIPDQTTGEQIWALTTKVPLKAPDGSITGLVGVSRNITLLKQTQEKIEKLNLDLQKRVRRLSALRTIDMTITANHDLQVILQVFLEQAMDQLGMDAAAVLLFKPYTQSLEYTASRGFRSQALKRVLLRLGEGYAGQAALEHRLTHVHDLGAEASGMAPLAVFAAEGFVTYFGVPLVAKGQVKGVLEVFSRCAFEPEAEWKEFLEALAGQAAIAIDSANLFDELQRANDELVQAYDATIEGWSLALELRDRETEGHARRVTEMTEQLARAVGVSETELVHVRRGALLHDIGKMAIPDAILFKNQPLTDEEKAIMYRHPDYAYQLLSSNSYLSPALEIPYCHHERWDGTGYPRGLKGEQIPLAARLFAVVDVWDALCSDRPYRAAWTPDKAREHICDQAGSHFDPRVVEVFLRLLDVLL